MGEGGEAEGEGVDGRGAEKRDGGGGGKKEGGGVRDRGRGEGVC